LREEVDHRGRKLPEFDLDAALNRRIALVDNWRTPTRPVAAIPSAGRTSTSCSPPASTC
jgi:hypothetical protein